MNHGRCSTCARIVIPEKREVQPWRFEHLTVKDILVRAEKGCTFCHYLDKGLQLRAVKGNHNDENITLYDKWESDSQYLEARIECSGGSISGSADFELRGFFDPSEFYIDNVLPGPTVESIQLGGYLSQITAAKAFLSDCLKNHRPFCGQGNEDRIGYLPRRVVDVATGNDDELRLYVPESPVRERYAALSYCWGTTNNFITTSANLAQHQQSFNLGSLPRTLQDAGEDKEAVQDWNLQASRMDSVYGNAHVTISAVSSAHADEGVLPSPCSLLSSWGHHLTLSIRALSKQYWNIAEQPVNTRAWCLQECLLSRRVIMLTLQGVIWQCNAGVQGPDVRMWSVFPPSYHYRLPPPSEAPDWGSILQEYSCRNLTNPNDKFHAIAALARRYRDATGDRYVAGLWESQLLDSLLWHHAPQNQYTLPPPIHGRPERYRAPSWSWASIEGYVYLLARSNCVEKPDLLAKVLEWTVKLADPENEFGEILSASLKVRGPLQKVVVKWADENGAQVFTADRGKREIGTASLDDPTDASWAGKGETQPAECLVIRGDCQAWGLLLTPNEMLPGTYLRKGVVWTPPYGQPTPCTDAPVETRIIV